jgi:hypothetical protein
VLALHVDYLQVSMYFPNYRAIFMFERGKVTTAGRATWIVSMLRQRRFGRECAIKVPAFRVASCEYMATAVAHCPLSRNIRPHPSTANPKIFSLAGNCGQTTSEVFRGMGDRDTNVGGLESSARKKSLAESSSTLSVIWRTRRSAGCSPS